MPRPSSLRACNARWAAPWKSAWMRLAPSSMCRGRAAGAAPEFARQEAVSPVRVLTLTVPVPGALEPLSVKTTAPIPRDLIPAAAEAIHRLSLRLPIAAGAILTTNICDSGADVVATRGLC